MTHSLKDATKSKSVENIIDNDETQPEFATRMADFQIPPPDVLELFYGSKASNWRTCIWRLKQRGRFCPVWERN